MTPVQADTIQLDEQPVHVLRAGDDAVPVLYLHGVPTSADDWLPFLERGGGIAVDLPGFGRSGKRGDLDFTVEGWARWVPRVCSTRSRSTACGSARTTGASPACCGRRASPTASNASPC